MANFYGTSHDSAGFTRPAEGTAARAAPMGTSFDAGSWMVRPAVGRCCARRKATIGERLRAFFLGPVRGFDIEDEPRCYKFHGHETRNAKWPFVDPHEDKTGRRWFE